MGKKKDIATNFCKTKRMWETLLMKRKAIKTYSKIKEKGTAAREKAKGC